LGVSGSKVASESALAHIVGSIAYGINAGFTRQPGAILFSELKGAACLCATAQYFSGLLKI
jgi:hypothetical protein